MPFILSLQCFNFQTHIPCVLFLFNIKPDNDPEISISFRADVISSFEKRSYHQRVAKFLYYDFFHLF